MFTFNENATQGQITTAIEAGGFTLVGFSVVGSDTQYPDGSVTVLLLTDAADCVGYRTPIASEAAGKTYVAGLISTHGLGSKFYAATVDDGHGTIYTLAEAEAW